MMERFRIAAKSDLADNAGTRIDVAGHRLAVFLIGDSVYAIGDRCSHAEASLAEGEVFDEAVECPRHGSEFDLRTGHPDSLPATRPVPSYEVIVEGDEVYVLVDPDQGDES